MLKFIKVTPKGEKEPRIVLATLKPFYLSLGAKVETPTEEEVYQAEPNERPQEARHSVSAIALQEENRQLLQRIGEIADKNAQQAATIAELREKLAATETALKDAESTREIKNKSNKS